MDHDHVAIDVLRCEMEHPGVPILAKRIEGGRMVALYLMASYLYYQLDVSLMADGEYDKLCQKLDKHWDKVAHRHKRIVHRGSLSATTGYYIRRNRYPLMVVGAAETLARKRGLLI